MAPQRRALNGFCSKSYGVIDCPYCDRKQIPKINANQVTCGHEKCSKLHKGRKK